MSKHNWTMAEDTYCCKMCYRIFCINRKSISNGEFIDKLRKKLCNISRNSIEMKIQNIKFILMQKNIPNTLNIAPLPNTSEQCERQFYKVMKTYKTRKILVKLTILVLLVGLICAFVKYFLERI